MEKVTGAGRVFQMVFENEKVPEITYNPAWGNGTGYFDHAVELAELEIGEVRKCRDSNDRRLLLVGTRFGTIVVFDRFINQVAGGVYVINAPRSELIDLAINSCGGLGESDMVRILGSWGMIDQNIGHRIEAVAKELNHG